MGESFIFRSHKLYVEFFEFFDRNFDAEGNLIIKKLMLEKLVYISKLVLACKDQDTFELKDTKKLIKNFLYSRLTAHILLLNNSTCPQNQNDDFVLFMIDALPHFISTSEIFSLLNPKQSSFHFQLKDSARANFIFVILHKLYSLGNFPSIKKTRFIGHQKETIHQRKNP